MGRPWIIPALVFAWPPLLGDPRGTPGRRSLASVTTTLCPVCCCVFSWPPLCYSSGTLPLTSSSHSHSASQLPTHCPPCLFNVTSHGNTGAVLWLWLWCSDDCGALVTGSWWRWWPWGGESVLTTLGRLTPSVSTHRPSLHHIGSCCCVSVCCLLPVVVTKTLHE